MKGVSEDSDAALDVRSPISRIPTPGCSLTAAEASDGARDTRSPVMRPGTPCNTSLPPANDDSVTGTVSAMESLSDADSAFSCSDAECGGVP